MRIKTPETKEQAIMWAGMLETMANHLPTKRELDSPFNSYPVTGNKDVELPAEKNCLISVECPSCKTNEQVHLTTENTIGDVKHVCRDCHLVYRVKENRVRP